ncbi:MAG: transporter suffix domain-containing protein [Microbacterium sp.]
MCMSTDSPPPIPDAIPNADAPRKKPIRFKIGVGLLILYPLMYLIIPIAPFLPIDVGFKVGLVAAVVGAAEGVFLLGVACVGKEAYLAIKARLGLGRKKRAREEAAHLSAEAEAQAEKEMSFDSVDGAPAIDPPSLNALEGSTKDEHV